jgi:hypothetical protein
MPRRRSTTRRSTRRVTAAPRKPRAPRRSRAVLAALRQAKAREAILAHDSGAAATTKRIKAAHAAQRIAKAHAKAIAHDTGALATTHRIKAARAAQRQTAARAKTLAHDRGTLAHDTGTLSQLTHGPAQSPAPRATRKLKAPNNPASDTAPPAIPRRQPPGAYPTGVRAAAAEAAKRASIAPVPPGEPVENWLQQFLNSLKR